MSYEQFNPDDLLIQAYSTKPEGSFGPHRIPTGIRVIHLPTCTVVSCNEDRSQHKNRHTALTQLWEQVQGKPSYAELAAQVDGLTAKIDRMQTFIKMAARKWEGSAEVEPTFWNLLRVANESPAACLAQVRAETVIGFAKEVAETGELSFSASDFVSDFANQYAESIRQEVK